MRTVLLLSLILFSTHSRGVASAEQLAHIKLPPGFTIEVYVNDIINARQMVLGDQGTLFVGSRSAGRVYAVLDSDGDGRHDRQLLVAKGLNMPSGLAFRNGHLYVAAVNRILAFENIEQSLPVMPEPRTVYDRLPDKTHHGWKFIRFDARGRLIVPVGAPCNVCDDGGVFSSILEVDLDAQSHRILAAGVRNSVGFDFHPDSGNLWFTDNGRDHLGDDVPDDELNHLSQPGQHFGFPHFHAGDVADPTFAAGHTAAEFKAPAARLGAHVAPLGMEFYRGARFPEEYRGDIFIAEHGSWNRSSKVGYRVRRVHMDGDEVTGLSVFAEGWLQGEKAWGRPAAVLTLPDGSLLVSDDAASAIYRIDYTGTPR